MTDDHVSVPRSSRGTLVVTFDDSYVWSFTTPRDGSWTPKGWRVAWPELLRTRLSGTTRVRVADAEGPLFEKDIAFGGNTDPLALRDSNGYPLSIDSAGHLTRSFSDTAQDSRADIIEGTRRALVDLRHAGFDAHLSYGCLLGAVRDGQMIGHDSDADLAYLSHQNTPAAVTLESYAMERTMRRLGWRVIRMSGADLKLLYKLPDGRNVHIDIFGAFHVGETFYQLGGRSGDLPRSALTPASTITLEGIELPAPADPEAVLAFLYGPSWRVPDPAFQNEDPPGGLRRIQGWMRGVRTDVVGWNEFYRDRRSDVPWQPSAFARWVHRRLDEGAAVADLGSGTGRDAAWFVRKGRPVLAFDISGAALRQTTRRLTRAGADRSAVRSLALNDRRSAMVAGAELARTTTPVNLYARQLVGCIDEEALDHLFLVASMALRRGGSLFLEFSAGRGPAPDPSALISRVDVDKVSAAITARGGIVDEVVVEPGQDFFDQPDPSIARIVAHWHHAASSPQPARKDQP